MTVLLTTSRHNAKFSRGKAVGCNLWLDPSHVQALTLHQGSGLTIQHDYVFLNC